MIKEKIKTKKDKKIYLKTKKYLESVNDSEIDKKMEVIDKVLKITDKEARYSILYDLICDYLDSEFKEKNICGFKCNICKRKKELLKNTKNKSNYENGCCYSNIKGKSCEYLSPEGCSIKNIACKTFTCFYLKKQGYNYKLNNIYLARYFFNRRQKFYMENTFFVDKNIIMKGILKRG